MASKILYNTAPTWPSKKCECKRIGKTARVEAKKWWTVVKVKYQPFEQLLHKWTIMPIHFYCRQQQFPYLSYATFCKHSAQVDPVRCMQLRQGPCEEATLNDFATSLRTSLLHLPTIPGRSPWSRGLSIVVLKPNSFYCLIVWFYANIIRHRWAKDADTGTEGRQR